MKLYYISCKKNWGSGIRNKINNHIKYFESQGFETEYLSIQFDNLSLLRLLLPFLPLYNYKILNCIEKNSLCYIRYNGIDIRGIFKLRQLKKRGVIIYVEIPTFPYDGEVKHNFIFYKDRIMRNCLSRYVEKILTYSDDSSVFGINCINISNFVDFTKILPRKSKKFNNTLNLVAVATLAFWHGYDRVIEGLYNYYKDANNKNIVKFHLVGNGPILEHYVEIVKKYGIEEYVIFYGEQSGKDLDQIYDLCDIAIDSLGRHRSKIFYNSSLKGKEYMAKGFPIISGVKTELDQLNNYPYYYRVPANDEPLNINAIYLFYKKIYSESDCQKVISAITSTAQSMFNIEISMKPLIDDIRRCINSDK